eukprot:208758-Prorocentrum_minimum.AAC.2
MSSVGRRKAKLMSSLWRRKAKLMSSLGRHAGAARGSRGDGILVRGVGQNLCPGARGSTWGGGTPRRGGVFQTSAGEGGG